MSAKFRVSKSRHYGLSSAFLGPYWETAFLLAVVLLRFIDMTLVDFLPCRVRNTPQNRVGSTSSILAECKVWMQRGLRSQIRYSVKQGDISFWISCAGQAAPGSNGGYQNANACQGSMYFYALSTPATHVVGQATEGAAGVYTMHVVEGTAAHLFSNTLHPAYTCSLTNTTPGGGDSVQVSCIFLDPALGGGMGSATVTGAIVNITGPN